MKYQFVGISFLWVNETELAVFISNIVVFFYWYLSEEDDNNWFDLKCLSVKSHDIFPSKLQTEFWRANHDHCCDIFTCESVCAFVWPVVIRLLRAEFTGLIQSRCSCTVLIHCSDGLHSIGWEHDAWSCVCVCGTHPEHRLCALQQWASGKRGDGAECQNQTRTSRNTQVEL